MTFFGPWNVRSDQDNHSFGPRKSQRLWPNWWDPEGSTENARPNRNGPRITRGLTLQHLKMTDQIAGVENARPDKDGCQMTLKLCVQNAHARACHFFSDKPNRSKSQRQLCVYDIYSCWVLGYGRASSFSKCGLIVCPHAMKVTTISYTAVEISVSRHKKATADDIPFHTLKIHWHLCGAHICMTFCH